MNTVEQPINQRICDDMTQLQTYLEEALRKIFEQAGSKINVEKQEAVKQEVEKTKQLLERFKSRYP